MQLPNPPTLLPLLLALPLAITALTTPHLTLRIPPSLPALPPSTRAILTTKNHTLRFPITRSNTFVIPYSDLLVPLPTQQNNPKEQQQGQANANADVRTKEKSSESGKGMVNWGLDVACRDYEFWSYGIDVSAGGSGKVEVFRVARGGWEVGGREILNKEGGEGEGLEIGVEIRVLKGKEFYEMRAGFSPLDLLKNPMILMAVVGLAFVFGMPYLMDSMDPEMKKEFEEQQKKSILSGGASTGNPLHNFDMAAWMAGKTTGGTGGGGEERERGGENGRSKGVSVGGLASGGGGGGGRKRRG